MTEETINSLCEKFHTTINNLIPIYSKYMITKDIMWFVISIILVILGVLIVLYIYRGYKNDKYDDYSAAPIIILICAGTTVIFCIISIIVSTYDCILWFYYPGLRFLDTVLQIGG